METLMPPEDDTSHTPSQEEIIGNIVNSAVTAHIRRFAEKQLPTMLADALKPIADKLNAPAATVVDSEPARPSKKVQESPEFQAMSQQLAAITKSLEDEKKARAEVETKSRNDRAYEALKTSLNGKVRPELQDTLAKVLFHAESRISFDEQGNPLFKSTAPPYPGGEPEDVLLPLSAGVDTYLKSESAKPFLPAPTQGAQSAPFARKPQQQQFQGATPARKATSQMSDREKAAASMEAANRVKNALSKT